MPNFVYPHNTTKFAPILLWFFLLKFTLIFYNFHSFNYHPHMNYIFFYLDVSLTFLQYTILPIFLNFRRNCLWGKIGETHEVLYTTFAPFIYHCIWSILVCLSYIALFFYLLTVVDVLFSILFIHFKLIFIRKTQSLFHLLANIPFSLYLIRTLMLSYMDRVVLYVNDYITNKLSYIYPPDKLFNY